MSGTELELPQTMHIEGEPEPAPQERERPRNPRDEAMARIAARYEEQQRAAEIAYGEQLMQDAADRAAALHPPEPEPEPEPRAEVGDTASPPPQHREPDPAPVAEVSPAPAPGPVLRTVMVQGQPLQVTEDQLLHLASIGAVANLAMQQHYAAPQPSYQPPQVPQEPAPRREVLDRDRAAQIVQRLSYGGPDDGVAAVQELASSIAAQRPQFDPQQIQSAAALQAYQQIKLEQDLNVIGREYPEVFNDRSRTLLAAIHLSELRQRDATLGQQRMPIDQYREACNMVRSALPPQPQPGGNGTQPAVQAAIEASPSRDRLERKRAAPSNPAAVSRAATLGDQQPQAPTGSQIVDQMRRWRGQTPLH